jgi:hypothetical protein
MWNKTVAKTGETEKRLLEGMEIRLITVVKELSRYLMPLWRKLAHDLAEDMHIASRLNNRNMSVGKMCYQFKVRSVLCLWNGEWKIVVESCLLVLRTAFSVEGWDVLKKKWHRHTHTNKLPTITDHHTAAVLNTMSQLCDSIQCRLTVRTGGSAKVKYWLYCWERSKQTEWKAEKLSIKSGHNNMLKTVTDRQQDALCIICGHSLTDGSF